MRPGQKSIFVDGGSVNRPFLYIYVISAMVLSSCVGGSETGHDQINAGLGPDLLSLVQNVEAITPILLHPGGSRSGAVKDRAVLGSYANIPVVSCGPRLSPEQQSELRAYVLDPGSYSAKLCNCEFIPAVVFRFQVGPDSADLQVSFCCEQWSWKAATFELPALSIASGETFGASDRSRLTSFEPIESKLKNFIASVFQDKKALLSKHADW